MRGLPCQRQSLSQVSGVIRLDDIEQEALFVDAEIGERLVEVAGVQEEPSRCMTPRV